MDCITHKEMQIIDINSTLYGMPREKLMENAGRCIVEAIKNKVNVRGKKIAIFCGTGNNGGDGFVAARLLTGEGAEVSVILAGEDIRTPEARKNFDLISKNKKISILKNVKRVDADIIIDALLGTGVEGKLREPITSMVKLINKSKAFTVSVDVPTGLGSDTEGGAYIDADLVVTFHKMKNGLGKFKTVVKDIGVPKEAELFVGPGDVIVNLGKREKESHKGDNGVVLVVGGSDLYYGAPVLTSLAAMRSGADLVYLVVPEANYNISRSFSPDLIVRKYKGDFLNPGATDLIAELSKKCDSLVIGPGIGERNETKEAVLQILKKVNIPVVIDADAIKAVAKEPKILKKIRAVMTPHAGEFKILRGTELPKDAEDRKNVTLKLAKALSCTVLLKAPVDIIASPDGKVKPNSTGNPGMTVGGTGDVLSGLVGSFVAQGLSLFDSACCAAFVNGSAGDELYKKKHYAFTASDLTEEVPYTIKRLLNLGG